MKLMRDNNSTFKKTPFIYSLGKEFLTPLDAMTFMLAPDSQELGVESLDNSVFGIDVDYGDGKNYVDFRNKVKEMSGTLAIRMNQSDTSLGGNDAINCLWAFNEDDDIIPPLLAIDGDPNKGGLGCVYNEIYNVPQQLLHMSFGVPAFVSLAKFYSEAMDINMSDYVNSGRMGVAATVGRLLGLGVKVGLFLAFRPITVPFTILSIMYTAISNRGEERNVSKYYEFRGAMPMYYKYVDTLLISLATHMKLRPNNEDESQASAISNGVQANLDQPNQAMQIDQAVNGTPQDHVTESYPMFYGNGFSIYNLLAKRDSRLKVNDTDLAEAEKDFRSSDDPNNDYELYVDQNNYEQKQGGWFYDLGIRAQESITGADKYISFRINKSTDASESISNSTGPSPIKDMLNSASQATKNMKFAAANGNVGDGVVSNLLEDVLGMGADFAKSFVGAFGASSTAASVMTGSGFFDIPDVWQNSSWSGNSKSISLTFRSPCGDPISIFTSVYVPLSMLLVGALPRSVGVNSYTSPFICRAYAKGMFGISNGMIENISITRGAAEFGWNRAFLPLEVTVNFSIKDLSPAMHIAMASALTIFTKVSSSNSSWNEYMYTLSGLGLAERFSYWNSITKKFNFLKNIARSRLTNPNYWGTELGNSRLLAPIALLTQKSQLPT